MSLNHSSHSSDGFRARLAWFEGARGGEGNIPKPEFDSAGNPLNETAVTIVELRNRLSSLGLN